MLPSGFEPAIPASKRPQTDPLDHTATAFGKIRWYTWRISWRGCVIFGAQRNFMVVISTGCCLLLLSPWKCERTDTSINECIPSIHLYAHTYLRHKTVNVQPYVILNRKQGSTDRQSQIHLYNFCCFQIFDNWCETSRKTDNRMSEWSEIAFLN